MSSSTSTSKPSSLRILILAPTSDSQSNTTSTKPPIPFPSFLEKLTGSSPSNDIHSFAGYTSHPPLHLKTKYYETEVNLWCDELPLPLPPQSQQSQISNTIEPTTTNDPPSLSEWQTQLLSPSALEVRQVIGAIILILPYTSGTPFSKTNQSKLIQSWTPFIETINEIRDAIEDETGRDVGSLVVLQELVTSSSFISVSSSSLSGLGGKASEELLEALEDECMSSKGVLGWSFVNWVVPLGSPIDGDEGHNDNGNTETSTAMKKNEFGEKVGFDRVIEVLEGVDWFASLEDEDEGDENIMKDSAKADDFQELDFLDGDRFTRQQSSTNDQELQREMMGLKMAMLDLENEDTKIDEDISSSIPNKTTSSNNTKTTATTTRNHDDVWSSLDEKDAPSSTGNDEEIQVDQLQALMARAIAVREAANGLSSGEREKFARREVAKMMRELG